MSYQETDDVWRLYRQEWVTVETITKPGVDARPCFDAAMAWVEENLTGRIPKKDINLIMNTDLGTNFWCFVQVFKDNLKGEFKHRSTAEMHATSQRFDEYTIVARNSKADHEIRNYGVKKL